MQQFVKKILVICAASILMAGCLQISINSNEKPTELAEYTQTTIEATSGFILSHTSTIIPSITPQGIHTPTSTSLPSPTIDPFYQWSIEYLLEREYGGGEIEIMDVLSDDVFFSKYLIRYPSDGLWIYGFLNIPKGEGPFPVIIALHGYIDPAIYTTIDYTTRYADDLARRGFVVFHPNLRNYPPSDDGENLFRVGMAIDVLNLIRLIQDSDTASDVKLKSDADNIGLWGHSMGGGISTRVMTVNPEIKAVLLYAAMSGDERKNFEAINNWSDGLRGNEELNFPVEDLGKLSPEYYLDRVRSAVSIHHGLADELVPVEWSVKTCDILTELNKDVECKFYPDMPHTFWGTGDQEFMENAAGFFNKYLRGSEEN